MLLLYTGQIELYTHFPIMRRICECLQRLNFRICGVYLLESQFIVDKSKYFAGVLSATSAMISLEIPHINVLSKMDLLEPIKKKELKRCFSFIFILLFYFILLLYCACKYTYISISIYFDLSYALTCSNILITYAILDIMIQIQHY